MSIQFNTVCAISFVALLGACAQQEEIQGPIFAEPVYNKYGDAIGCRGSDGQVTSITGANYEPGRNPCEPEECVEGQGTVGAANIPCPPPYRDPEGGDEPTGGQNPTGGQIVGAGP